MLATPEPGATLPRRFLPRWILTNTAGLALSLATFALLAESGGHNESGTSEGLIHMIVSHGSGALAAGAVVGLGHWLALRRVVPQALGAGAALHAVAFYAGFAGGWQFGAFPFDFLGAFLMLGAASGAVQWWTLRRRLAGAVWLAPLGAAAMLTGGIAGIGAVLAFAGVVGDDVMRAIPFALITATAGVMAGLVGSALTGLALRHALRRATAAPAQSAPASAAAR